MIDLRSDTATRPSAGMRAAIAAALVGDEQKREDPTVIALEEHAAELLGHEEAVFLPTATMANQIALRTLTEPGDEVLAEEMAHVFRYELGGPAVHSGLVMKSLRTAHGIFSAEDVREAVNPPGDLHTAPTRLVCSSCSLHRSSTSLCGMRPESKEQSDFCNESGVSSTSGRMRSPQVETKARRMPAGHCVERRIRR